MPRTITLKNIPDDIYERLKVSARAHRRSINNEAISCFEQVLMPRRIVRPEERLDRIRRLQASLGDFRVADAEIDAHKREGRP
jgi:plasmid stability protein